MYILPMRTLAATLLTVLTLAGCPPVIPPPNPPPDTDWCGRACEHLQTLGCEEGEPVYNSDLPGPEGEPNQTCQAWCEEMQDPDHVYFVNPRCLAEVPSCDQIEPYRQKDPADCTGQ